MLTCTVEGVNALVILAQSSQSIERRTDVAEVQIQDGMIRVLELDVQDPRAAEALAEYPQARWAEVTRRAIKIGLGYLKGGGRD